MQVYSDASRESEPFTLPDVEVFYVSQLEINYNLEKLDPADAYTITEAGLVWWSCFPAGWYWWSCFPGCLPDSEPFGPYDTEAEAVDAAQNI